jgi:hypothetical protein
LNAATVNRRAVGTSQILEYEARVPRHNATVRSTNQRIIEEQVATASTDE